MVKSRDDIERESYSVRLNPELIRQLKHVAVDEKKSMSQLIEEAIALLLQKHKKAGK